MTHRPADGAAPVPRNAPRPGLSGRVTINEIAAWRGVSVHVIRIHRGNHDGGGGRPRFPGPVGIRRSGRRGPPMLEYRAQDIRDFYRAKEQASPQARRGLRHSKGRWSVSRRVDDTTIARRLGLSYHTVRSYPARYAGTSNPFPPKHYSVLVTCRAPSGDKPVRSRAIARLADALAPYSAEVGGDSQTEYAVRLVVPGPAGHDTVRTWRELAEILGRKAVMIVTSAGIGAGLPPVDVTHVEVTRDGMRRWGDIEAWEARRAGSGRHEHRTPEQKHAARRAVLQRRAGSDRQARKPGGADT